MTDEKYALTRITKTKGGVVIKTIDHDVIITEMAISWNPSEKKEKIQILRTRNARRGFGRKHLKMNICQVLLKEKII